MQARDPKRDRPAGAIGRPGFGVGPIARVGGRPGYPPPRPAGPEDRRPPGAPPSTGPVTGGGGLAARTPVPVRPPLPGRPGQPYRPGLPAMPPARGGFGLPEPPPERLPALLHDRLARRDPDPGAAPLKALIRQDANVSRCQLRGGVHLEQGYVNDVCLTPRFNQCVFYEDDLTRE